jgi:uncharacterized protein YciI
MLYAIMGRDAPDSLALRAAARPAHLARLLELKDAGRLVLAGPHPVADTPEPGPAGMAGSLIIAEFASLAAARDWANSDPYVTQGIFASVEVRPFLQVLP